MMDNKELLLMGGDPYAEATHWLTVAHTAQDNYNYYGFANIGTEATQRFGEMSPRTVGGYEIQIFEDMNDLYPWIYLKDYTGAFTLRITNLITGTVYDYVSSNKTTIGLIGLKEFVGQTIPLKLEFM